MEYNIHTPKKRYFRAPERIFFCVLGAQSGIFGPLRAPSATKMAPRDIKMTTQEVLKTDFHF